jgi:hypothetical protein
MRKIKDLLGTLFESDGARSTRHLREVADSLDRGYTTFIEKARKAGFTGPQAEFMWTYMSLNNHVHEYRMPETGFRPLTNPPLNKRNAK